MKWSGGQKALLGVPVALIVVLVVVIVVPTAIATAPETTEATRLMRTCPRAVELLGKNIEPKQTGVGCGCHDSDSHDAHHILRYNGTKTTGTVEFRAEETDGRWRVTEAELLVDGERIDLVACSAAAPVATNPSPPVDAPPPPPVDAMVPPSVDAARRPVDAKPVDATVIDASLEITVPQLLTPFHFTFSGRIGRTTHPTLMPDVACTGTITREDGAAMGKGQLVCGGKVVYEGMSAISVRRGVEVGQLYFEYFDGGRPTAMISFSDSHDIVRISSTDPVWEYNVVVTEQSH